MEQTELYNLLKNTLPVSDLYSVSDETMWSYVRHGLFLKENSPYCRELSDEKFMQFVFYPRVNSEEITDCRAFFYEQLKDRVNGLSDAEAVLEVNRWCAEQMTYQPADVRTKGPMAAYFSGVGRCGEESVFLVTALRSVGIAARQIYAPWWAHCDDNHAWVEVFVQGRWQFLGACEPEPVLNRGWFVKAAARAPMICYRTFYPYTEDGDAIADHEGCAILYNVTERYADTCELTVSFPKDQTAEVVLSVVNMAGFQKIASAETDADGTARFRVGKGSLRVEAFLKKEDGSRCLAAREDIDLSGKEEVFLKLKLQESMAETEAETSFDSAFIPPEPTGKNKTILTEAQEEQKTEVLNACALRRKEKTERWFLPAYRELPDGWQKYLCAAGGNAPQIYSFYGKIKTERERSLALQMLDLLSDKDPADLNAEILENWFAHQLPYCEAVPAESDTFRDLLNPRIDCEVLTDRRLLVDLFTETEQELYRKDPEKLYAFLKQRLWKENGRFYPPVHMTPEASVRAGMTDDTGLEILACACMKVLGIPAHIDPLTHKAVFYRDDCYRTADPEAAARACLNLEATDGTVLKNDENYTLSILKNGRYCELGTAGSGMYNLPAGQYRLVTAARLPNGKQLVREQYFSLQPGEEKTVSALVRNGTPEEMLDHLKIEPFVLEKPDGTAVLSTEIAAGEVLFLFADPGKEPTVHILTELLEKQEAFRETSVKTVIVLQNAEGFQDALVREVLEKLPDTYGFTADRQTADLLARAVFKEPGVLPLLILTDSAQRSYFSECGYRVGTASLLLQLTASINKTEEM